ncbi:MAG: glutamate cyclase domain-containing protein [Halieaceae bacterium]|jgi:hypothetical protein|nr:glutamate cyclase domain-containing protein [Halieaceae bacterium]
MTDSKSSDKDMALSKAIENLLVDRNHRGMAAVQEALEPGYYLRAAQALRDIRGTVLIGTGFPVDDTYETDGPVGALALYETLEYLGAEPVLVCGTPLSRTLAEDYRVHEIAVGNSAGRVTDEGIEPVRLRGGRRSGDPEISTLDALVRIKPSAVVSIERPGLTAEGRYYNMLGEDITERCACFDYFVELAGCPTIAIGDGGNEIGMGNVLDVLEALDIEPSTTRCDELLVADVSNWGAYGLIALLGYWRGEDLLAHISPRRLLNYLSERGSVDGVTREPTPTEDGFGAEIGETILHSLRELTGFGETA